jgi:uncharacterized protein DUF6624
MMTSETWIVSMMGSHRLQCGVDSNRTGDLRRERKAKMPAAKRVILVTFMAAACAATPAGGDDKRAAEPKNHELRAELKKRVKQDQDARFAMLKWMQEQGPADPAKVKVQTDQPLVKKLTEIDEANTKWLKEIVAKYGWPGKTLVGADGAHDAWLLVQHADRDREFQKKCLDLMKPLVAKDEVAKTDFAYLTDRVLVAQKKKQLYGTQFTRVNGKMEPQPIEDEANVDKRRAEMGMSSLSEYRTMIEKMYQKK